MGGYYSATLNDHLTLVVINTNYYFKDHSPPIDPFQIPDPAGQFAWMESILSLSLSSNSSFAFFLELLLLIYNHDLLFFFNYYQDKKKMLIKKNKTKKSVDNGAHGTRIKLANSF